MISKRCPTLGEALRFYRESLKLSQRELGEILGCSYQNVGNMERESSKTYQAKTIEKLRKIGIRQSHRSWCVDIDEAAVTAADRKQKPQSGRKKDAAKKPNPRSVGERMRDRSRLQASDKPGRRPRDQSFRDPRGCLLRVQGLGHQQPAVLAYEASKEEGVILLGKAAITELFLQNKARVHAGLSQVKVKVRTCMDCKCRFESIGPRFCAKCGRESAPVLSGQEMYV